MNFLFRVNISMHSSSCGLEMERGRGKKIGTHAPSVVTTVTDVTDKEELS